MSHLVEVSLADEAPRCLQQDAKLKTTYEEPVHKIRPRDQPTYQSTLFTGYDYCRRGGQEKRFSQLKIDLIPQLLPILATDLNK